MDVRCFCLIIISVLIVDGLNNNCEMSATVNSTGRDFPQNGTRRPVGSGSCVDSVDRQLSPACPLVSVFLLPGVVHVQTHVDIKFATVTKMIYDLVGVERTGGWRPPRRLNPRPKAFLQEKEKEKREMYRTIEVNNQSEWTNERTNERGRVRREDGGIPSRFSYRKKKLKRANKKLMKWHVTTWQSQEKRQEERGGGIA